MLSVPKIVAVFAVLFVSSSIAAPVPKRSTVLKDTKVDIKSTSGPSEAAPSPLRRNCDEHKEGNVLDDILDPLLCDYLGGGPSPIAPVAVGGGGDKYS
ncbi:hypothetical protein CPB83DRAFT_895048 [Crepidotus variabilis]|uniref:Uncharacterized protein n=1 Tax=Crepidotus variabilis TaxID=179855 RepID=A0A9P6JPF8_9AGAR|nr:hypothetical protein CPB83DRAFT_895048 [Crepidotus variabilis]